MRPLTMRPLTMTEIEQTAEFYKEDLQRDANRYVRQGRTEKAMASLESRETIDRFVYQLQIRAGSQLHTLFERRTRGKKPVTISDSVQAYGKKLR